MHTVFLAGASGFIGRHMQHALSAHGFEIRTCRQRAGAFDFDACLADMSGVDYVINAAGLAHSRVGENDAALYHETNAVYPVQLAQCALAAGVRHFVQVSSVKAAAYNGEAFPNDLHQKQIPTDIYGASKRAAEEALQQLSWGHCSLTILRTSLVYGAGVKANLQALISAIAKGWLPPVKPSGKRSLISAHDLCAAIVACLQRGPLPFPLYVVCEPTPYDVARIHAAVRCSLGRDPASIAVPGGCVQGLSSLLGLLPMDKARSLRQKLEVLMSDEVYCAAHFEEHSGWRARQTIEQQMPVMLEQLALSRSADQQQRPSS